MFKKNSREVEAFLKLSAYKTAPIRYKKIKESVINAKKTLIKTKLEEKVFSLTVNFLNILKPPSFKTYFIIQLRCNKKQKKEGVLFYEENFNCKSLFSFNNAFNF